jgi:3'-phosphoadenosine 5'-phosphosulfate sulfotransferase (PAPS reductase)/FAD synthetase
MIDPFAIDGPAVVSFSGGRTSAYMLRRMLDVGLRPDVHVLFADTGKERVETYAFVRACAARWGVAVHWIERPGQFTQLITDRKYLPNPVTRFCTSELKIRPMRDWMLAHGYEHWTNVVGIRADEPRRVAKMRATDETSHERWDIALPLADDGATLVDVEAFWLRQPFRLELRSHEGNCDLCFLKGTGKLRNIVRERPDLAAWWADQERRIGATFRKDRPSYADMLAQPDLFTNLDEHEAVTDLIECYCHD